MNPSGWLLQTKTDEEVLVRLCWRTDVTFYKALVVMFLQKAAVVGQLLVFVVFVRLSQEIRPR